MITGVDDQGDEFAHIGDGEVGFFFCLGREICEVRRDHPVNISVRIVLIKFAEAVGEQPERSAYEHF